MAYTIYRQDIGSFNAVMQNNEKQILDFQEELIKEHLKSLAQDINYLANLRLSNNYINSGFDPEVELSVVFSSFLKRRGIYSSVRIIDSGGFERYRMNYSEGVSKRIEEFDLQAKGNRYYFNEIMISNPEDNYFSQLDLNYEGGEVQFPYEPVIRVGKLFLNENMNKVAFIILNYNANDILNFIDKTSSYSFGKTFLHNNEELVISLDASMSVEKSNIIDFLETEKGKLFIQQSSGQIDLFSGYLTHKRINITDEETSPTWDLISFVDRTTIKNNTEDASNRGKIIFLILFLISITVSFFAAKNKINKINTNLIIQERARIFDLNPAPVLKVSKEGEILSSNTAAKTILGLTLSPPSVYKVFNKLEKNIISNFNSNNINTFEYQVDSNIYYFTNIKDKANENIYFYGTDITSNYKIREDLRNFQTAVKQSANVIVFTDLEGRVLFANDAFEKVTGYSSEEVLGNKSAVLNSGFHSNSFYDELWDTIKNGNVWSGEFYNKRKDGTFFWEKATISPVLNNEGKLRFFIAVKEDITEKKDIEAELKLQTQNAENARISAEKSLIEAESANLLKSTFLANMSHEIRTPMNAILGFTRLLLDKEMHKKDRDMLNIIMNSGKSLLSLINDILDFSKIEANEIEFSNVKINLSYFFESIEDLFHIQTTQKNLGFKLILSNNLPKIVIGDENRIRQILINIIGNAIKFTESGSISISVDWNPDNLIIVITDTGIGIKKDKLEDIFSPFKQSDSSTDRKYEGTGLGLAISLKLTEMMDGTLNVVSQINEGSTFTLSLPLKPSLEHADLYNQNDKKEIILKSSGDIIERWLKKVEKDKVLTSITRDAITALPKQLNRLEKIILSEDTEKIQAISHELMGSTGNLGMTEIYELLKELNTGIKNGKIEFDQISSIFQSVKIIVNGIPEEYLQEYATELLPVEGDLIDINILTADDSSVNRLLIKAMLSSIYIESDFAEDGIEVLEKLKN
ncbi:MAG: PAS domain S-box protein, partial [Spirochaetales bacterium]|nr:PAS domain S-box protein [Spirochaetales bacterium]